MLIARTAQRIKIKGDKIKTEFNMHESLFSKDDLKPQKKYEREHDFKPKKRILTAKELFAILDKKRDELNAKGDFISMGCPYKTYLKHKDEIDKECERLNELKIHKKAISKYVSSEVCRLGLAGKEKLTYGEISKILNIDIKSVKMIEDRALQKLSVLLKDKVF